MAFLEKAGNYGVRVRFSLVYSLLIVFSTFVYRKTVLNSGERFRLAFLWDKTPVIETMIFFKRHCR